MDDDEKEFLNLWLKFYIRPKYNKIQKEVEIELLYENLFNLQRSNKININDNLADHLRSESKKHRNHNKSNFLDSRLIKTAKKLKNNEEIIVRRSDKATSYVILHKSDYFHKIDYILSDTTKFKKVHKDITEIIKQKANKIIMPPKMHFTYPKLLKIFNQDICMVILKLIK